MNNQTEANSTKPEIDDDTTGFNMETQKLHCLIVLQDSVAKKLSEKAGDAFWRGFITEDRATGEVMAKYRFRYMDGDSWVRIRLNPEKQQWPISDRVEHLAQSMEQVLRLGMEMMSGGHKPPEDIVVCFYPPEPDDSKKTLEWLIAQDLIEVKSVFMNGKKVPIGKEAHA
jgi:hypothetical protein